MAALSALAAATPEITIDGGPKHLRENILHYLNVADEPCSAPLWRLNSLLLEADDEIEKAAQAVGYYQLRFTKELTQAHNCWQLRINVVPGDAVKITNLNFILRGDGTEDESFKALVATPDIHVGDTLNHGTYENFKNKIATLAAGHGYFDGRFDLARVQVYPAENTANVDLIYNTGTRYRVGEIRMTHKILDEAFLRRYLNINTGDWYDTDKLLELKTHYNASNYFSVAMASPDLQNLHDQSVDIDVQLEERKRRAYSIGLGASTTEGGDASPRVLLGFEDRYVNSSGHSVKLDASKSAVTTDVLLSYKIPMSNPSYEFFKIYTGIEKEVTDSAYSDKDILGASYTYYQANRWLHTYAVNIENEDYRVASEAMRRSHLIIPSVTFSRTTTDGNPYPLMGWSLLAKLSGSPNTLGSDISYEQLYARAKYILPVSVGRVLLRAELGVTEVNGLDELPKSVRYFAGGSGSVRGYDYEALGPRREFVNDQGELISEVTGGKNLFTASVEYDYQFRPSWAAAVFFDVGNASDDFKFNLKRGAGVGIRWISPIGPVRVDVARGLDDLKAWNFHISMGPDL